MPRRNSAAIAILLVTGCTQPPASPPDAGCRAGDLALSDSAQSNPLLAARPYQYQIPACYDPSRAWPLVMMLHGHSVNATLENRYLGFGRLVDSRGFLYAFPDGTLDPKGAPFWNAADDYGADGGIVDDLGYLSAVLDDMVARYHVDPKRIFLAGHSNGAFMEYRLACDRAGRIAAIASLAGAMWAPPVICEPSEPVAVLEIHGDSDQTIAYGGDKIIGLGGPGTSRAFASAPATVAGWAKRDGCDPTPTSAPAIDLLTLPGDETTVSRYSGCKPGGAAELWTMQGADHIPALGPQFAATVWDFLAAHPKP